MIAGAFELDGLAVEKEAFFGIEFHFAYAEGSLVAINNGIPRSDLCYKLVEISLLERPEHGVPHYDLLHIGILRTFRDRHGWRDGFSHCTAGGIENRGDDTRTLCRGTFVLDLCANGKSRFTGLDFRWHEGSPLLYVDGVCLHQPDMAVNPSALVEPAITRSGIDAHEKNVPAAGIGKISHIVAECIVSAAMHTDIEAVEDHHCFAVGAIEFDRDSLAGV